MTARGGSAGSWGSRLVVGYRTWTQALHMARSESRARLMEAQGGGLLER